MKVFILHVDDTAGPVESRDLAAAATAALSTFGQVTVRTVWQSLGSTFPDDSSPATAIVPYQDQDGYLWLDMTGDGTGMVCVDTGVANKIRYKYPRLDLDTVQRDFGPLALLGEVRQPARDGAQ